MVSRLNSARPVWSCEHTVQHIIFAYHDLVSLRNLSYDICILGIPAGTESQPYPKDIESVALLHLCEVGAKALQRTCNVHPFCTAKFPRTALSWPCLIVVTPLSMSKSWEASVCWRKHQLVSLLLSDIVIIFHVATCTQWYTYHYTCHISAMADRLLLQTAFCGMCHHLCLV